MDPVVPTCGGYEAIFVTQVPEDLICIICHLALREPRQMMECGHRFCGTCFEALVSYSKHLHTELLCPVDRTHVDVNAVFKDKGAARTVRNLEVKCSRNEHGCHWTGGLGDLAEHNVTCLYQEKEPSIQQKGGTTELEFMCKDLLQRVVHCEETLISKEKELIHLKCAVKEMKEVTKKNENEILSLKCTVKEMKEISKENENETVSLKEGNNVMKSEIAMLKQQQEKAVQELRDEASAFYLTSSNKHEACTDYINEQITLIDKKIQDSVNTRNPPSTSIQVENLQKDIRANRSHIDRSINKAMKEIEVLNGNIGNMEEKKLQIEELKSHVDNGENVMYLYYLAKSNIFQFQWVLQNYEYHFEKGERVYSPTLFSQVLGCYRVRLLVEWTGVKKEKLGFFFQLIRGENKKGLISNLKMFNLDVDLEILSKGGKSQLFKMILKDREQVPQGCVIPEDKNESPGYGRTAMLTVPYNDYIIENSLYLTCSVHLKLL